ncbi:PASTA domain-containing protein [Amycolatopsis sp. 195334CR]|uniref:PASTA domain-containing protein n=1 Tax=Amycolatopsis sp. 195334CR TaxID=2814588 RepID=UPI001A8C98C6|nr:PASTA domain-containing protein [Amycolatopsis sp. 195334CR]MBN6040573.1 PASTA domain-containing protein [Amycolatopsis sp. 195334CR]
MDERRHADVVTVPDVVGMTVRDGRRVATEAGVALAQPDPDGPPLGALTWPGVWVITAQDPPPGSQLYRWDSVRVWFRRG